MGNDKEVKSEMSEAQGSVIDGKGQNNSVNILYHVPDDGTNRWSSFLRSCQATLPSHLSAVILHDVLMIAVHG